jgi:RNA polymerase sigma-70 factor (ECF subfamily)
MTGTVSFRNEASGLEFPRFQSVSPQVERETVDRACKGDQQALGDIYDWYMPRIYRYAVARLGNTADAEDMTEEVFVKMLGAIGNFRWKDVPFSAWIFRIAHNHVASHFRTSAQRGGATVGIPEDLVDRRHDLATALERQMQIEEVRRATELLPDAQREVIALRFVVGLSITETANVLGKREGNVKALQHKAVAKLQRMLIPRRSALETETI